MSFDCWVKGQELFLLFIEEGIMLELPVERALERVQVAERS